MRKTLNELGAPKFTVKNKYLFQVKGNTKVMAQNEKNLHKIIIFNLI